MSKSSTRYPSLTIGLDLGKRFSRVFALSADGEVVARERENVLGGFGYPFRPV